MKIFFFIAFIFCMIYGTIMFFTNITKTFFMIWMDVGIGFYILYRIFESGLIDEVPFAIRKLSLIACIILFIVFLVNMLEISRYFNSKPKENLDYLIVLGALVTKDGPAMSTIYRLDETIEYLNNNKNTKCILTGGKGKNEPDYESVVMAEYIINHGIDKDRLYIETESTSTFENLENSKQFLDPANNSVAIVTNNFHICRSMFIAKKIGYKDVCGLACYSLPINVISNVCRETVGLIIYKLLFLFK